jgi:hypothetical protein
VFNFVFQDLELIVQILLENNYDIDVTISEILQVMCIVEDQGKSSHISYSTKVNKYMFIIIHKMHTLVKKIVKVL